MRRYIQEARKNNEYWEKLHAKKSRGRAGSGAGTETEAVAGGLRQVSPFVYDALTRVASLATSNGVPLPPMLKYALEYQTGGGGQS